MESGESQEIGIHSNSNGGADHRSDPTGKPALANPLSSAVFLKKTQSSPSLKSADETVSSSVPFHCTQNFTLAMVALIAVCVTITVLALTGHLGGSGSHPAPLAKQQKPKPSPTERTTFKSTERGEIKDMVGKNITITGDLDRLEQDDKGRYLIFKDSDARRDVMLFFDKAKTETSEWILKRKFVGQKVRATGTVQPDGSRLLLELSSMEDLKLHADEANSQIPN